jgi:hypothetical protein
LAKIHLAHDQPDLGAQAQAQAQAKFTTALHMGCNNNPVTQQHKNAKGRPKATFANFLLLQNPIGAGEEIRTLDPNLGKVMLYP